MWLFTPTAPGTALRASSVFCRSSPSLIPWSSAPGPGFSPLLRLHRQVQEDLRLPPPQLGDHLRRLRLKGRTE